MSKEIITRRNKMRLVSLIKIQNFSIKCEIGFKHNRFSSCFKHITHG